MSWYDAVVWSNVLFLPRFRHDFFYTAQREAAKPP
jgi:hypothetical protein